MLLIRGGAGSGKTAAVLQQFRSAVEAGRTDVRIVVPTSTLVRHLQHELARDGLVFSPRLILSLNRFARECAPSVKTVPGGLRRAFVQAVLKQGVAAEFNEVASTEGMTATVLDTMDLFENAGFQPTSLKGKRLQPLGAAFLKVWSAVEQRLSALGFVTRRDFIRAAMRNLPTCGVRTVWMDGFVTFSQLESEFLVELAKHTDLTIALPSSDAAEEAYRTALSIGTRHRFLEGARPRPYAESFTPPTMEREADEICHRILRLVDQGAAQFREIGVAIRDNAKYLHVLRAAFERFGIPVRFYYATLLSAHVAVKFLGGLIECALSGWEFERALETLRLHPRWCASPSFDNLDFALRKAMPARGAAQLAAIIEQHFPDDRNWLRLRLQRCLQVERWLSIALTPKQWSATLASMTETLDDRPIPNPTDYTSVAIARTFAAALHAWTQAVEEAVDYWPADQKPIGLEEFWKIVVECIAAASLRPGDERRNVVHVMSAFEARQWDVRVLFVCGMTDRSYPQRHQENLLFPEAEAKRLGLRTAQQTDAEESKLFPSLRSRARDLLVLSAPLHDTSGRTLVPSRFLLPGAEADAVQTPWVLVQPAVARSTRQAGKLEVLGNPALLTQLAGLHKTVSATGLESLAQCKFQFFARQALRLKPAPDRPEKRFNFLVQGNILHDALRRWSEAASPNILAQLEDAFEEACRKDNIPESYALEVKRFELRSLMSKLDLSAKWQRDESLIEHELRLELRSGIEMKGRADRIDTLDQDCIIIDYKSGAVANVKDLVEDGTRFQGPLYALAASRQLGLRPVAMVYWALQNGRFYGWGDAPGLQLSPMPENWMEAARDQVVEELDRYLSGEIHARPANETLCRRCDYRNGCRVGSSSA